MARGACHRSGAMPLSPTAPSPHTLRRKSEPTINARDRFPRRRFLGIRWQRGGGSSASEYDSYASENYKRHGDNRIVVSVLKNAVEDPGGVRKVGTRSAEVTVAPQNVGSAPGDRHRCNLNGPPNQNTPYTLYCTKAARGGGVPGVTRYPRHGSRRRPYHAHLRRPWGGRTVGEGAGPVAGPLGGLLGLGRASIGRRTAAVGRGTVWGEREGRRRHCPPDCNAKKTRRWLWVRGR